MDNPYRPQFDPLDLTPSQPPPLPKSPPSPLKIVAFVLLALFMVAAAILIPSGIWFYNRAIVPAQLQVNGWYLDGDFTGPDEFYDLYESRLPGSHLFVDINTAQIDPGAPLTEDDFHTVTQFPHLTALYIYNDQTQGDWLEHLAELHQLEHLHLDEAQLNDSHLRHIENLTNLTDLSLTATPITDVALLHLHRLSNLDTLYLDSTKITGTTLHQLANLRNLKHLYLDNSPIDTDYLRSITNLPLEVLSVTGTQLTDEHLAQLTPLAPTLTALYAADTQLTDSAADTFAELTNLQFLYLNSTAIADHTLQQLLKPPNLTDLYLAFTQATGEDITVSPATANLTTLILNNTPLTDQGLANIAQIKTLQTLDISNTLVTEQGLTALYNHPALDNLHFSFAQFSTEATEDFAAKNPRVRLHGSNP